MVEPFEVEQLSDTRWQREFDLPLPADKTSTTSRTKSVGFTGDSPGVYEVKVNVEWFLLDSMAPFDGPRSNYEQTIIYYVLADPETG